MADPGTPAGGAAAVDIDVATPPTAAAWQAGDLTHIVFDGIMLVVVAGYMVLAVRLGVGRIDRAGPGFFPFLAGSMCATFLVLDLARFGLKAARGSVSRGSGQIIRQIWMILVAVAVYIVLVKPLGHAITSTIVAVVLIRVLGTRSWLATIITAIGIGLGTDAVFAALGLPLPAGIFEVTMPWTW